MQQIQRTHWTPFQNNGHSQVKRTARYKRPEILLQISPWNPPLYFYSFNITTQGENHCYKTRQSDQIRTNRTSTHFANNRLKIYLPPLINSVPTILLQKIAIHSIHGFSSSIKRYYIGNYSNKCSIPNCYICQRAWKLLCLKRNKAISISFSFHYTIRSDVRKPS